MTTMTRTALLFIAVLVSACGGSGSSSSPNSPSSSSSSSSFSSSSSSSSSTPSTYTVGGIVSGLSGSGLVLQNNSSNDLTVTANGPVTFSTALTSGGSYNITIKTQPTSPSQTCSLAGSTTGTITNANIAAVSIICVTNAFTVSATVTGLTGSALVLQNNAGDDITVNSNGAVIFPTAVTSGASYSITVRRQPVANSVQSGSIQFCDVMGGIGVVGNGPANTISINCRPASARFVYVPNLGDNTISAFSVNAATGALTPVPGSPLHFDFPLGTNGGPVAAHPFGATVYVFYSTMTVGSTTTSGFSAFRVDSVSGALTPLPGSPFATGAASSSGSLSGFVRVDPTGRFLYVYNSVESRYYVYRTDQNTGVLISGATTSTNVPPATYNARGDIAFDYNTILLTANGTISVSSYWVDPVTGERIGINGIPTLPLTGPIGVDSPNSVSYSIDASGTHLYFASSQYSSIAGVNVNPITGQLSAMPGSPFAIGGLRPTQVALDRSGKFLYVIDRPGKTVNAFSIDQNSGALLAIGSSASTVTTGGALSSTVERGGYFVFPDNSTIGVTRRGPTTPSSAGIYAINQFTGALTALPGSPFAVTGTTPEIFTYEPSGKFAYLIDTGTNTISAHAINTITGTRTFINSYPIGPNASNGQIYIGRQ